MDFEFTSTQQDPSAIFSFAPTPPQPASPPKQSSIVSTTTPTLPQKPTVSPSKTPTQLSRKRKKTNPEKDLTYSPTNHKDIADRVTSYAQSAVYITLLSLLSFSIYSLISIIAHDLDLKVIQKSNGMSRR
jgi:dTDP-4-dehydrorhamnose reductase